MQRTIQQLRQPISIRAKQYFAKTWVFYVLLVPALLDVLVFQYIPMYGVQIAFRRYKASQGIWGSKWVGLKYILQFMHSPSFGG